MSDKKISIEEILDMGEKLESGEVELMLDLAGDEYADPKKAPVFEYLLAEVVGVTQETPECVVVHFEGMPSVGFPTCHSLKVERMVS